MVRWCCELLSGLPRVLIVNADDFGLTEGVNEGIAISHEQGIVTSTSLMVRRPAAASAAAYARGHTELSVGLHVDLGEWVFRDGEWRATSVVDGPADEAIDQQLAIFRELIGREPSHLDSHQHVHRDEPVASALAYRARLLAIPVRGSDPGVRHCGDFYGQTAKGDPLPDQITVDRLIKILESLPEGVTELGCHPGVRTAALGYGVEREREVSVLCDGRVRAAISKYEIDLTSFAFLRPRQ